MLQILQNLDSGETEVVDIPSPQNKSGHLLIETSKSLVSVGTERMLVDFGKAGVVGKVRSQPDKVKMVIEKIKTDGVASTYEAVRSKLDQPLPLGYCNVGRVIDSSDTSYEKDLRVVSNGNHAEIVRVPKNLVATVPDEVDDETAAFTVLGAIALQGIRLIKPNIGETVVVTGLGLIGLLAVQILRANGCRVLGIDFDSSKCELARSFGADTVDLSKGEDPESLAHAFSRGNGVDAVLITASSKSNDIVHQAANMCRKRGNIVLVGVVGLELSRTDFYEKELTFQVSCSYGPGRYDKNYEDDGHDYPYAFVRWTEQRNFEAVLDLMASGAINVKPLISSRFDISSAKEAYQMLDDKSSLGILLNYPREDYKLPLDQTVVLKENENQNETGNVAFIGGGNYASRVLIPAFKKTGANLTTLVTSSGINSFHHGIKNNFKKASTDINEALDKDTDVIVIATQHDLHAKQAICSLDNGKHVFVEKPLALNSDDIDKLERSQKTSGKILMVGYNRRFSPHVKKIHELLSRKPMPKTFIMTMNAGEIPKDHWTQDHEVGGGRIIGEACHYIDLMRFLSGSRIKDYSAIKIADNKYMEVTEDKSIISLVFEDGSIGVINYLANGGKSFPKERIEVFCDNAVLQLDNFRKLRGFGWQGFNRLNLFTQDKGQANCVKEFMNAVENSGSGPIPQEEIFEIARVSVDIAQTLRN